MSEKQKIDCESGVGKLFELGFNEESVIKRYSKTKNLGKVGLSRFEFPFHDVNWKYIDPKAKVDDWYSRSNRITIIGNIDPRELLNCKVQNKYLRVGELDADTCLPGGKRPKVIIKSPALWKWNVYCSLRRGDGYTKKVLLFDGKVESVNVINSDSTVQCNTIKEVIEKSKRHSITITLAGNLKRAFNSDSDQFF